MRHLTRTLVLALSLAAAGGLPAAAADAVVPGNPNPTASMLLVMHPETNGVFESQSDGSVRHVQSGFVCPAGLPDANLWRLMVFPSPQGLGTDVGCDYGRIAAGSGARRAEAKVSIFLTRGMPGITLDAAFAHYLAEMHGFNPPSVSRGAVFEAGGTDGKAAPPVPSFRSQAEEFTINGRRVRNELVVGLVRGWIVELRATYPLDFAPGDTGAGLDSPVSALIWTTAVAKFAATADQAH